MSGLELPTCHGPAIGIGFSWSVIGLHSTATFRKNSRPTAKMRFEVNAKVRTAEGGNGVSGGKVMVRRRSEGGKGKNKESKDEGDRPVVVNHGFSENRAGEEGRGRDDHSKQQSHTLCGG